MGWYPNFWGGDTAQMGLWDGNGSEGKWRELRWVGSWEALAHTIQGRSGWRIMIKPPDWFEDLRKIGPNHRVRSAKGGKTLYFPHSRMMRRNMLMVVSVGRWSRVPWIISEFPEYIMHWGSRKYLGASEDQEEFPTFQATDFPGTQEEHLEKPWTLEWGRIQGACVDDWHRSERRCAALMVEEPPGTRCSLEHIWILMWLRDTPRVESLINWTWVPTCVGLKSKSISNAEINLFFVHLTVHTLGILMIFEKVVIKHVSETWKTETREYKVQKTSNFKPLGAGWGNLKRSVLFRRESAFQKCFLNYIRK